MKLETQAIHAGYESEATTKAVAVPIYQTVAYEFDDAQHGADLFNLAVPGNIYTRIMNPTNDVLEQRGGGDGGRRGFAGAGVGSSGDHLLDPQSGGGGQQHRHRAPTLRRHLDALPSYAAEAGH